MHGCDQQAVPPVYIIVWDNVNFHRAVQIREWFTNNQCYMNVLHPPHSPFLNPIEGFSLRGGGRCLTASPTPGRIYWRQWSPVKAGFGTKGVFPHCLARDCITCDVDEVLWPDPPHTDMMVQTESVSYSAVLFIFISFFVYIQHCHVPLTMAVFHCTHLK